MTPLYSLGPEYYLGLSSDFFGAGAGASIRVVVSELHDADGATDGTFAFLKSRQSFRGVT